MEYLSKYRYYKIYEVSESDYEITGSTGSRYIRNSILIFSENQKDISIGNETAAFQNIETAQLFIDANQSQRMADQLKNAKMKSDLLREKAEIAENEYRRKERETEFFERQRE